MATQVAVTETLTRLNTNLSRYGLPPLKPKFMLEILVFSGIMSLFGAMIGKLVDEYYPKSSNSKSMIKSTLLTFVQAGLLGILIYVGKETIIWGSKKVYTTTNDPFYYATIVMSLTLITVQKSLQTKLSNL